MATPKRELSPGLEAVEDAIVAALAGDATIAAYVKDVRPFQGSVEQAVQEAAAGDRSLLVMFAGMELEQRGEDWVAVTEWHVHVRCRNLRGEKYSRRPASATEVGAYQMVQDVLRVLTLQDFDLDGLAPIKPDGAEAILVTTNRDRTLAAYTVVFHGEIDMCVVEPDDAFTTLVTSYEVPDGEGTFAEVATETVSLE